MGDPSPDSRFDAAYAVLAALGEADAVGSREYFRVRREWQEAGRPSWCIEFIGHAANRPSTVDVPPPAA